MTEVLTILAAAAAGLALARWWRLPTVPLLIIGGIALQLSGVAPPDEILQDAMMLGLAFLVFVAGTELNPSRVGPQRRAAIVVGIVQFLAIALVGVLAAKAFGLPWDAAIYIGLALTASSTLVVVTLLRQRQQFFEPFGRLVLGVLLMQDILVIAAIGALARVDEGMSFAGLGLLATLGMILLAWINVRWIVPRLLRRLDLDEESLLLAVLALLFAFIGLAWWLNLPLVVGAFLAGVSLSGFPANGLVRGQVHSLADFFLATFFVTLGAVLGWLGPAELLLAAVLTVLVLLLTPPLVAWIARRIGLTSRVGIESGLLLAQCSEFSLVVALLGLEQGHLSKSLFHTVAAVTVLTMILTPFVATDRNTWQLMRWRLRREEIGASREDRPSGHVLLLGCGSNGVQLAEALQKRGERVVVVDDDPAVVRRLREQNMEAVRGDGADYIVLRDVGARSARAIVSRMRRTQDHERLLRFTWEAQVPVLARLFDPNEAERLAVLGAVPLIEADIAAEAVLAWFDERFDNSLGNASQAPAPATPAVTPAATAPDAAG